MRADDVAVDQAIPFFVQAVIGNVAFGARPRLHAPTLAGARCGCRRLTPGQQLPNTSPTRF